MTISRQDIGRVIDEYRRSVGELQYRLGDFGAMNDLHKLFADLPEGPLRDVSLAKLAIIISKSNESFNLSVRRSLNSFLDHNDSTLDNMFNLPSFDYMFKLPRSCIRGFKILDSQHLLTEENVAYICRADAHTYRRYLIAEPRNYGFITVYNGCDKVADVLAMFAKVGSDFSAEYRNLLLEDSFTADLSCKAYTMIDLYRASPKLLRENREIFSDITGLEKWTYRKYINQPYFGLFYKNVISRAIIALNKTRPDLLTIIRDLAISRTHPQVRIIENDIMLVLNRDKYNSPWNFVIIFYALQKAGLLTPENEMAVLAKVAQVGELEDIINILDNHNLLTQSNLAKALANTDKNHLEALNYLAGILILNRKREKLGNVLVNQINVDGMFNYASILFSPDVKLWLSDHLISHVVTQATLDAIFAACRSAGNNVDAAKEGVILTLQRLRGMIPQAAPHDAVLGGAQSTHTASINRSTSESAAQLKSRFTAQLSLPEFIDQQLEEARAWLARVPAGCLPFFRRTLPISHERAAALRGLDRIIRRPTPEIMTASVGDHIDPVSNVSIRETVALLWYAIHDDTKRQGSLTDALKRFEDALYELQREYNFNDAGIDINPRAADNPACACGTFNKLYEKFVGVFSFIKQIFLTPALAALKLPKIVFEETLTHLKGQTAEDRANEITRLSADGVSVIWPFIIDAVTAKIRAEFGAVFTTSGSLEEFIAAGQYSEIDISRLERELPNIAAPTAAGTGLIIR